MVRKKKSLAIHRGNKAKAPNVNISKSKGFKACKSLKEKYI